MQRSEFLKMCAVFGIGFPYLSGCSSSPKTSSLGASVKVVVVGGGISGLIAALHLAKSGVEVTLLEREPQVGGRVYSESLGGVDVNLGAQYFFKSDNDYLNLYVKKAKKFYPPSGEQGALWDGKFASANDESFFLELPIDEKALEDWERSIRKMQDVYKELMVGREYVFDNNPASKTWSELDRISAEQYLSAFHPDVANLFNMFLIPEGGAGVDQTSALLLTGWYGQKEKSGQYLIEGGNQQLPQAMADDIKKLGGTIHLSTTVSEVVNVDNGVKVQCSNDTTYEADYAIVTTPATVAKQMVKGLSEEKLEALDAVIYGASMQVGLHLRNLPIDERISACIFHKENINAYFDQSQNPLKNETVISLNIAGAAVHELSDEQIIQRVSGTLQKIYPDFDPKNDIVDYSIKKWKDGIVRYPPGFLNNYVEAVRAPSGRIYFGGDYTHSPALDGAAWSGVRAADHIQSLHIPKPK